MGVLLVGKADAVISRLKSGEAWQTDGKVAPRTTHGEKRIRKCIKYDLGWGFRLITVLRNDVLYICYLGPHDQCDRWLAENSRLKKLDIGQGIFYRIAAPKPNQEATQTGDHSDMADDLDYRLQELSDQSLRRIFRGLVEARRRPGMWKGQRLHGFREKATC